LVDGKRAQTRHWVAMSIVASHFGATFGVEDLSAFLKLAG
jgi:hypothetical protein